MDLFSVTVTNTPKLCLGLQLCMVVTGNKPKQMLVLCYHTLENSKSKVDSFGLH